MTTNSTNRQLAALTEQISSLRQELADLRDILAAQQAEQNRANEARFQQPVPLYRSHRHPGSYS